MKGTIQVINARNHRGKIMLNDGRESSIIKFPETFETGDIAEVKFRNNDPSDTVINLSIPGNEWYFGFIMIPHGKRKTGKFEGRFLPYGNILPTYPKVRELLFYHENELNISVRDVINNSPVKFKIMKAQDGKVSAVDISEVGEKDQFKCKTPIFGRLEVRQERTKTGFVKKIIKTKQSNQKVTSGKVRFFKQNNNNELYGFIERDDGEEDIYFKGRIFEKFYNKEPKIGDKVIFCINSYSDGRCSVRNFCEPQSKEYLPQNEQYGTISNSGRDVGFLLQDYENYYHRTAEEGDIVYYNLSSGKISFKNDESEVVEKVVMRVKNYTIHCPNTTFKNFLEAEPNELYYMYSSDKQNAAEVYKFDEKLKSESISCYKNKNISKKFKLLAIENLISIDYRDKRINKNILIKEKEEILTDLQNKALDKKDFVSALRYEGILQQMKFYPSKLSKFSEMASEFIFDFSTPNILTEKVTNHDNKWLIQIDEKVDIDELKHDELLLIDLELKNKKLENINKKEQWLVDLKPPKKIKTLFNLDEAFNI